MAVQHLLEVFYILVSSFPLSAKTYQSRLTSKKGKGKNILEGKKQSVIFGNSSMDGIIFAMLWK